MAETDHDLPDFDAALIKRVSRHARLHSVILTGSILTVDDDGPIQDNDLRDGIDGTASITARGSWDIDRDAGVLGVVINFAATPDPGGEVFESPYFIGAEFRATYLLSDVSDLEDEALFCFARWNGQFNTWPYMREFVQTTAVRAGLGVVEVPLFRTPSAVPPTADVSGDD